MQQVGSVGVPKNNPLTLTDKDFNIEIISNSHL